MHNFIDIDIILKPGIIASVEVEFDVLSYGYTGDRDFPPESNEYDIVRLCINNVVCFSTKPAIKVAWYKTGRELIRDGWHDAMCKLAKPLLEGEYDEEWQQLADHEFSIQPSPC